MARKQLSRLQPNLSLQVVRFLIAGAGRSVSSGVLTAENDPFGPYSIVVAARALLLHKAKPRAKAVVSLMLGKVSMLLGHKQQQ